ncbi:MULTISPECIES: pyrroline-5-carboxylate reductase [Sphingomonas]|uniref:Pyrroline-5-carboxylate reductase n=1 Tax=Sphingomonas molluscorum TaxID=418184 RepID=A0ABU8Q6C3_9SPHN|nr:pyrroline-5-carboxylate reductase [Sphingomonas sp. JUb134]
MTQPLAGPIWLVGCGNMAGAMLRRWLETGHVSATDVTVINRSGTLPIDGIRVLTEVPADAPAPATVMLGVKPQQLDIIAQTAVAQLRPKLLLSILAGVENAALAARFQADAIVRAMPNLPVSIGKGVVALHSDSLDEGLRGAATALMAPLGTVEWIGEEGLFDAVTALSGCGPGFVFRFIDAMGAAGAALGLPEDQARRLAIATVEGAGALASGTEASPATLADRVASPGGSTREGLNVLDREDALRRLMAETLAASARRNAEMAAAARG